MLTFISKWLLFASSYIPLYIIIAISIYPTNLQDKKDQVNIFNHIISLPFLFFVFLIVVSTLLFIAVHFLIKSRITRSKGIKVTKIKNINTETINYLLAYIIPFVFIDKLDCRTIAILMLFFWLIGSLYVKNNLLYLNPMLYFLRYNIYSVTDEFGNEYILISKVSPFKLKQKEEIVLSLISEPIYKDISNYSL